MSELENRSGSNINKVILDNIEIERNSSNEITKISGEVIKDDLYGITKKGTKCSKEELEYSIMKIIRRKLGECILSDEYVLLLDENEITIPSRTKEDFSLPLKGKYGSTITWYKVSGSNIRINNSLATTMQTYTEETVVLKAMLSYHNKTVEKNFTIIVEPTEVAKYDKEHTILSQVVTNDFTLPSLGYYGSNISWIVFSGSGITISGNKALVNRTTVNQKVILRATFTYDDEIKIRDYLITVQAIDFIQEDIDNISLPVSVSNNFILPTTGINGSSISWIVFSGNGISILGSIATVTKIESVQEVVLRAIFTLNNESRTKDYLVTVEAINVITEDINSISLPSTVDSNFSLPTTGYYGSSISWMVYSGSGISISGNTALVNKTSTDQEVILRATFTYNLEVETEDYYITVKSLDVISEDINFLSLPSTVDNDFSLPTTGYYGSSISWMVYSGSGISISGSTALVNRTVSKQNVILRATFSYEGDTQIEDYNITVEALKIQLVQTNYDDTMYRLSTDELASCSFNVCTTTNDAIYIEVNVNDSDFLTTTISSNPSFNPSFTLQETQLLKTGFTGDSMPLYFTLTVYDCSDDSLIDEIMGTIYYYS